MHIKFAIRELSRYRAKGYCKDKSRYNRVLIITRYFIRFRATYSTHPVPHSRFLLRHFSSIIRRLAVSSVRPLCVAHISRKCTRRVVIFLCPFQRYLLKQNFRLVWQMLVPRSHPNLYGGVNYSWQPKPKPVGVNGLILMTRNGNASARAETQFSKNLLA